MARRTKEDALATRDLILDTAELVFQRRGVSRTSLQEIAQEAGLTRGAIYWHFENKQDLFHAMLQRVTLPLTVPFREEMGADTVAPLDQLRRNVARAFHQTVHDARVRRVFEIATQKVEYVEELQDLRDRHITQRGECMDDIQRMLAQAQALGHLAPETPLPAAAVGLHALVDGLMTNWLLDPQAFDLQAVGSQTLDAYLAGLNMPATQPLLNS